MTPFSAGILLPLMRRPVSTEPRTKELPMSDSDVRPPSPVFPPAPDAPLPLTGYVLLWFPLASETFIFHEVRRLAEMGLPVRVYTMYASRLRGCSQAMRNTTLPVRHFGIRAAGRALSAFCRTLFSRPRLTLRLVRDALCHPLRTWETRLEALVCFLYGFLLAEEARRDGVQLLHASWGNGPATAAWVASRLTGIPFSFTGRANDIYPQDGILPLKARDALFIRTNNKANGVYLRGFCPQDQQDKVHVVYNGLTLGRHALSLTPFMPEYRLLSIGRFVPKKGFADLLTAVARLRRENVPARLTLIGDGRLRGALKRQCRRLGITDIVDMPGFLPHDRVQALMRSHDIFLMPSVQTENGDRDGIPNVIMEALSSCMPVIATDVCGIGEVIRDGETGLLVPQRDPRALAEGVRRLLADREAALRMAGRGQELVLHMFDSEANTRQLLRLYRDSCACVRRESAPHA